MCFQLWEIILLPGVREQLHHVTFLEPAIGEAVCVIQTPSEGGRWREAVIPSLALHPLPRARAAAQPSPTLRVVSLSACTPRTRT